jgi:phage gp16-like protein
MTATRKHEVGVPARFNASDAHRRGMLAKVHIAKKQLRLSDDDYAAVLIRETGHDSAGKCSQAELEKALRAFERQGFTTKAKAPGAKRAGGAADHPSARKARAMWISLGLLGAINDTSEAALESFARRQLGCDRLQWANQTLVYKLVEALKAMAERHGWRQSAGDLPRNAIAINLKRRLCEALMGKLWATGMAPADWTVQRAAWEFAGVEIDLLFAGPETLDLVARSLGAVLADNKASTAA